MFCNLTNALYVQSFGHGQLSGRYHSRCLSSLHELSALAPGSCVRILRCLQSLVNSMPRAVSSKDRLWHLFTDGALEASKPSIGGVLDFFGHPRFHFSFEPPALSVFTTFGSHCILHLEILPILVALHLWPDPLHGHFLSCGQRSCTSFSHSRVMRQPCGRPACPTLPAP